MIHNSINIHAFFEKQFYEKMTENGQDGQNTIKKLGYGYKIRNFYHSSFYENSVYVENY